jgi:hypothetical protein
MTEGTRLSPARRAWKRTPTPELEALIEELENDACEKAGYDLDLVPLAYLAFKTGYEAAVEEQAQQARSEKTAEELLKDDNPCQRRAAQ